MNNIKVLICKYQFNDLDKVEIVIYKSISEYTFECYLLRKTQGKGYKCNYVVDIDFYKL